MRLRWTRAALGDLKEIRSHIAVDDGPAARRVGRRLREAAERLCDFPYLGRPSEVEGTREKLALPYPYVIVYEVLEPTESVVILRVYHMSQDRE